MRKLIKNPALIITVDTNGKNFKRGKELSNISVLTNHSILIENGIIKDLVPNSSLNKISADEVIDVKDKIVLPGLVECHTHAAFAGSRSIEFFQRLKGASYEEILQNGGGIISTVQSVRNSSYDELINLLQPKIDNFISQGITTLEIKSGYGLSYYDEIKLLQVINHFKKFYKIDIIPTFLGAHVFPLEYKNDHEGYLNLLTDELLPYIIKNNLSEFVDIYCESSAFNLKETELIISKAKKLNYKIRIHTNQFNSIGGIQLAIKHKVLSVDHLEVINENEINDLAESETVAVLLPGASFFSNTNYAPARSLIDKNAIVALSTDYNPGTSNIINLHLIMSLAAIYMKMTAEEIISSVTINAAKALSMDQITGSIEINKLADFAIFDVKDYKDIIYNIGQNLTLMTIKKGEIIYQKT
ncbi:MAG: imidazolonepropionase [Melioribacter sp.]|uniref:imidazolonepropionase n=1 Tax=Rosettibacter primus TaxID=3111523 RepID=UPI00247B36EF|nr:imidazolonepropionase [Melioribacter sp.]